MNVKHVLITAVVALFVLYLLQPERFTNIIVRPLDFNKYDQTGCPAPLYNDKPGLKLCNKETAKYYDTRFITPGYSNYYRLLSDLLSRLSNKTIPDLQLTPVPDCPVPDFEVKNFINKKIADVIVSSPEFQNNGSFKFENITTIDYSMDTFKNENGLIFLKVLFNLFDTTRSASTQAFAIIKVGENVMNIEDAGLVYPDIIENDDKYPVENKLGFDIYDSLQKIQLGTYVDVPKNLEVHGGISKEMEDIIDKYYNTNS